MSTLSQLRQLRTAVVITHIVATVGFCMMTEELVCSVYEKDVDKTSFLLFVLLHHNKTKTYNCGKHYVSECISCHLRLGLMHIINPTLSKKIQT